DRLGLQGRGRPGGRHLGRNDGVQILLHGELVDDGHSRREGEELKRPTVGPGGLARPKVTAAVFHLEKQRGGTWVVVEKENRFSGFKEKAIPVVVGLDPALRVKGKPQNGLGVTGDCFCTGSGG